MSEIPPQQSGPSAPAPLYYPRPRVDFDAIGLAWKVISADWGAWIGASALMLVASLLIAAPLITVGYAGLFTTLMSVQRTPGNPPGPEFVTKMFAFEGLIFAAILFVQPFQFVFNAGMMEMALRRMEGQPISATDVFLGFRKFGRLYLTGLLYSIAVMAGSLCFVPALIFAGLFCFAPILIMRGQAKGLDALSMSWQILVGDFWMIILLVFCAQLLSGLGVFGCYVCIILTMPWAPITIALTYRNFFPSTLQPTEGPRA